MQIITGKYRARKLSAVNSDLTRPTLARVKESIFNMIQGKIENAVVLDLFAGSGAFGAECISRGAKKVYFIDNSKLAIQTIKQNTKGMSEDFEIINDNFINALQEFLKHGEKFDIVYLDPPYNSDFAMKALEFFSVNHMLNDGSTIVVEHAYKNDLQNLPKCYIMEKSKKYGIALVDIYTYKC